MKEKEKKGGGSKSLDILFRLLWVINQTIHTMRKLPSHNGQTTKAKHIIFVPHSMKLSTNLSLKFLASFWQILHDMVVASYPNINGGPLGEMDNFSDIEASLQKLNPKCGASYLP